MSRRLRLAAGLLVLTVLAAGGWLWLRDSPLVAVEHVSVSGQFGPDGPQIRRALVAAAKGMTTLDVNVAQLRLAVAPFPVVRDLGVEAEFPHGLRIRVIEEQPLAALEVGGRSIPVSADGTLLPQLRVASSLPSITMALMPAGPRVSDRQVLEQLAVLAAAPVQLLSRITQVTLAPMRGVVVQFKPGPSLYFGSATELRAKWAAAAAVLASPGSVGALYVDVSDPRRPAAGGGAAAAAAAATAASPPPSAPNGSPSAPAAAAGPASAIASPQPAPAAAPAAGATPAAPPASTATTAPSGTPSGG